MNNYLKNKVCYFGGPIESVGDTEENWRVVPKEVLIDRFGINVYDPFEDPKQKWSTELRQARMAKDYDTMRRIAKRFVSKDLTYVYRADFTIHNFPRQKLYSLGPKQDFSLDNRYSIHEMVEINLCVPTFGSTHEVIAADDNKKPSLLICEAGKELIPAWFYGIVDHKYMFGSWEELYSYLDEVNRGLHMDNPRWALVYGLI